MSTKPHYFKIGVFAILATVLILVAIVVFGAGLLVQRKVRFETYFDESITGLSVGSPVEYRGVRIGQVDRIGFVGRDYDLPRDGGTLSGYERYVRVVCSVPEATLPEFAGDQMGPMLDQMVARGLRVRVTSNILTGQAYLEANYLDPIRFPVMEVTWKPMYPYVPSALSELTTMKDSLDKILYQLQEIDVEKLVASLEHVLVSLDKAVTDADLGALSREAQGLMQQARQTVAAVESEEINAAVQALLASLNAAVVEANVPELSLQARRFIAETRATNEHLKKLLAAPEGATVPANLPDLVTRLGRVLSRIDTLIVTERPEIEIILADLREVLDNLTELTGNLKARPSDLLFSKPPIKSEALK